MDDAMSPHSIRCFLTNNRLYSLYLEISIEHHQSIHRYNFSNPNNFLKILSFPSRFQCQTDRKISLPSTTTSRPVAIKRQRLAIIQEALEESKVDCNTVTVNMALPLNTQILAIGDEQLQEPIHKDKCVQVYIQSKYFKSKYTQTERKLQNIGTYPSKILTAAVATSPFKVEEHVKSLIDLIFAI